VLRVEGMFWFETGDRTRKARNLARDPRCTFFIATRHVDIVVEGRAEKITDPTIVKRWRRGGRRRVTAPAIVQPGGATRWHF